MRNDWTATRNMKWISKSGEQGWSSNWDSARLSEVLNRFGLAENKNRVTEQKVVYASEESSIEVVYDKEGMYFRGFDESIPGKKNK